AAHEERREARAGRPRARRARPAGPDPSSRPRRQGLDRDRRVERAPARAIPRRSRRVLRALRRGLRLRHDRGVRRGTPRRDHNGRRWPARVRAGRRHRLDRRTRPARDRGAVRRARARCGRRAPDGRGGQRAGARGRADLAADRRPAAGLMRSPFGRARRAVNDRLTAPRAIERVASLGPLPPAPTGIATYHRAVLDGLARIGFTERLPVDPVWPVRDADFATVPSYRLGISHLGNNADFHLPIYRMVWEAPGLIVLHDLSLDDFVRGLMTSGDKLGFVAMREALDAREGMSLPEALANKPLRIPWIAAVARRARGIVVHADFCRRYLEDLGCRTPVFVVPHPAVESPQALAAAEPAGRRLRGSTGAGTLVVAPGDINEAKQLDALLAAVRTLPDDVHVAIVGRTVETYDFAPIARRG